MEGFQIVVGTKECPIRNVQALISPESTIIQEKWTDLARGLGVSSARILKFRNDLMLNKISHSDVIAEVLELWVTQSGSAATLGSLLEVLEQRCRANGFGESIRLQYNLPCKGADDGNPSIGWSDLTPAFQKRVMDNLGAFYPNVEFAEVLSKLKGTVLIDLMTCKRPPLFKQTLPEKLSYYVHRTILTRNIISSKIFEQDSSDIFLFTGMDRSELSSMAKHKLTSSSREQLRSAITAQFIILEQSNHFEKICEKTCHPVHLLRREADNKLRWIRSNGGMHNLQKLVDPMQDAMEEEAFCKLMDSQKLPVVIADSPGMGKSVLLSEIGNKLTQMKPERAVIFLVLSEFIKLIKQLRIADKSKAILKALQHSACENPIGEAVLTAKLISASASRDGPVLIELLLDGFDEVDSADIKLAHEILKTIQTSFKSIRMWVTSRPHHLEELENSLGLMGYNIRPFHDDNQVRFLTSFWSSTMELNTDKIKLFSQHCLKSLKSRMSSTDQDIAGIPLQCLLIGEVYKEDALEYASPTNENESEAVPEIEIVTITTLYQRLVENKLKKYKSIYRTAKLKDKRLMDIHAWLSVELLFPEYIHINQIIPPPAENEVTEVLKVGILESASEPNSYRRFIHRTFAEYFAAWVVIDRMERENCRWGLPLAKWFSRSSPKCGELTNFLIQYVLETRIGEDLLASVEFSHPVICFFLNSLSIHLQAESFANFVPLPLNSLGFMRKIARACASADFANIFKFFETTKAFEKHGRELFTVEFVYLTVRVSSLELVKSSLTHFERHHSFTLGMQSRTLQIAVERGLFSIVEFLIKGKQLHRIVEELNDHTRMLLHDCVAHSRKNSNAVIEQKVGVLRMLVGINPTLLEIRTEYQRTPILASSVHVGLLIELVKLGVDVLAVDINKDTVLHLHVGHNRLSAADYHSFLNSIPDEFLRKLVHMRGEKLRTPLMNLLRWLDPSLETLDAFQKLGADFNCENTNGITALAIAIGTGRTAESIRMLIHFKANVEWRGSEDRKTLLHLSVESVNVSAVEVLVDENGFDVNIKDDNGLTPLDYAIKADRASEERFESGMALHDRGGIFQTVTLEDKSVLHRAVGDINLPSIRLLLRLGMDVNGTDEGGNTPLHSSVQECNWGWKILTWEWIRLVEFLLDNGANPNQLNGDGKTPFQLALENEYLHSDTFHLLKSKTDFQWTTAHANLALKIAFGRVHNGFDSQELHYLVDLCEATGPLLSCVDEEGNSALHISAINSNLTGVRFLAEDAGADVNSRNNLGETPLHSASSARIIYDEKNLKVIKYLIEKGADPTSRTNRGESLLHFAVAYRSPDMLKFLLDLKQGPEINAPDEDGDTPLHWAVYPNPNQKPIWGVLKKCRLLIKRGADVDILNKKGCSPLAAMSDYMGRDKVELIGLLRSHSKYSSLMKQFNKIL